MSSQRRILYLIDPDTGMVISRVGDEFAWPILDFDHMKPENNFETGYFLQKVSLKDQSVRMTLPYCTHTRKIPLEIKNQHRRFWGMKMLTKRNKWEIKAIKEYLDETGKLPEDLLPLFSEGI